ncbi:MAG: hypothetical protein PHY28_06565 [Dehalococcoidales bacterium]|nr:hypothetical protein [Dehalococcoidales bacterium]
MTSKVKPAESTKMAQFIKKEIKSFVRNSPLNRLPDSNDRPFFDEPLVKFADGDDKLFAEFKTIIGPAHLTPREALSMAMNKKPGELLGKLSVISWVLPITLQTRKSNREQNTAPSIPWAYTRWYGEKLNEALRGYIVKVLTEMGYMATAPVIQAFFKQLSNEKGPYSNWSERHIAYVAGQGTFSLSDGFITEKGIAHRCGSVVTDLTLPISVRTATTPYSNCLYYVNKSCKACIARCPADAITEAGHDKIKCQEYHRTPEIIKLKRDLGVGIAGCGLCQVKVPCEFKNPTKKGAN